VKEYPRRRKVTIEAGKKKEEKAYHSQVSQKFVVGF
jgi:hypothetical protein